MCAVIFFLLVFFVKISLRMEVNIYIRLVRGLNLCFVIVALLVF